MLIKVTALGLLFAVGIVIEPAAAAVPACSGMWKANEQLTRRTRSPIAPNVQFIEPCGNNGWMLMNIGGLDTEGAEWYFASFNGHVFQVYGSDAREQMVREIDDHTFQSTAVRHGKPADTTLIVFSPDCKRVTFYVPEGTDRRTGLKYYNDVRVYDKIEP